MDYTTFNAEAAKELTNQNKDYLFNKVMGKIQVAAERGENSTSSREVTSALIERLRELDYILDVRKLRGIPYCVNIRW